MNRVVLAIVFCCAISCVSAQFSWGVKAGVNVASTRSGGYFYPYYLTTYNFGFTLQTPISRRFNLLTELLYSRQGSKLHLVSGVFHTDYISMPILAAFYVIRPLQIVAGPEVGYLVTAFDQLGTTRLDALSSFRRLEGGFVAGVRFKLSEKLNFEVRYVYGLTGTAKAYDTYNNSGYSTVPDDINPRNMVFQSDVIFLF